MNYLNIAGGTKTISLAGQRARETAKKALEYLLLRQSSEGFWVFDLEADVTIPSEYVMLQRFLGRDPGKDFHRRVRNYLLAKQMPDGGWPLFDVDGPADVSASVKAYFALKLMGEDHNAPHMVRARQCILSLGGAAAVNVFTRITLALFGQIPWHTAPAMPVEIMLLPRWFFFHLSKISYWSRTVMVPLLLLYAKQPVCRLEPHECLFELFVKPATKLVHIDGFTPKNSRKNGFILLDRTLKRVMPHFPKSIHRRAVDAALAWTRKRMQGAGGIGAIYPAMANAIMALRVFGASDDDPDFVRGMQALDDLMLGKIDIASGNENGPSVCMLSGSELSAAPELDPNQLSNQATSLLCATCQPCVSPVWDSCLSLSALCESGLAPGHAAVDSVVQWLFDQQILTSGDWSRTLPHIEPGGFAFQFENDLYPDVDDTSMVVMALLRAKSCDNADYRGRIVKAVRWTVAMQNSDGGWAAFDIDNDALYLNDIPFADHGALLDPSTSDLTGRCIEMLGMLGYGPDFKPIARGIAFLKKEQDECGGWFGRWGVNFLYGTWSVLAGLNAAGEDMQAPYIRRAVDWLKSCQNADGGFGETCLSYNDPQLAGKGASTPSQTSWALLGLLAAGEVHSQTVSRGINYLVSKQKRNGTWDELHFTGTGFPRVFYLRYHGYRHYFPLWALSVYRRLCDAEPTCQAEVRVTDFESYARLADLVGE